MTDKRWSLKPSRDEGYELAWIDENHRTEGWWLSGEQARELATSVNAEEAKRNPGIATGAELPDYFAPKPTSGRIAVSVAAPKSDAPVLWRFYWDVGRQGDVEGIFVASHDEIAAALGQAVYFGEILGKHSDVHGVLEEADLTMLTADPTAVEVFQRYVKSTGYNPLDYLEEEYE